MRDASLSAKRAFLESRGLTQPEIEMAFSSAEEVKREISATAVKETPKAVTQPVASQGTSLSAVVAKV